MYTEEPRREINWGNIFKKVIIIAIIVAVLLLIFWLIVGLKNKNKTIVNVDNNPSNNSGLNENYYSKDYIDSYRYFHDTVKEYFLVSEIPENGSSIKYTLRELINKGLILPFGTNNKSCDTDASYVLVTNINGEYTMTITLVCGNEIGKTTEELGCNQLCPNGNCTTPVNPENPDNSDNNNVDDDNSTVGDKTYTIEYEYTQEYTEDVPSYSCENGYTKDGKKCYKSNDTTIKPLKNTIYTCSDGYTKIGDGENTKCVKNGSNIVDAIATKTYTCSNGYTKVGEGENTKCVVKGNSIIDATVTYTYSCSNGYTKVGDGINTKCIKGTNETIFANYYEIYVCPYGYDQIGIGINSACVKNGVETYSPTKKTTTTQCPSGTRDEGAYCVGYTNYIPSCKDGYTLQNNSCVKTVTVGTPVKKCASGYTLYGSSCVANNTTSSALQTKYTCSTGVLENDKCKVTRTKEEYKTYNEDMGTTYLGCTKKKPSIETCPSGNCNVGVYTYYCPAGSSYYTKAKETYSCASGYSTRGTSGSQTKCYKIDNTKFVTQCNSGSLNASKTACVTTQTDNSKFEPTCPSGYTKQGSGYNTVCKKSIENIIEIEYDCPYGGEYQNDLCVIHTYDRIAPTRLLNYYCPSSDYILDGTMCRKANAVEYANPIVTPQYSCKEGTLSGNKCIIGNTNTTNPTVTINYYCSKGTLSGTKCIIDKDYTTSPNVSTSYSCKEGTLDGNKCIINTTNTTSPQITYNYICQNGYMKYGEGENATCSKGSLEVKDANITFVKQTKLRYQWSSEENLDGWTKTGKSRKIEASVK